MSPDAMTETAASQQIPTVRRTLVLPALLGVISAALASVFIVIVDEGQILLFERVPAAVGLEDTPWWWMTIVLIIGALIVMLARRLPGATGQGPLTGFHFDVPPRQAVSVLLAAFGTLAFGIALGPEAPLIVLGSAAGALLMAKATPMQRRAAMLLGGTAAIGAVFGNPFVTGFMVLELAAMGMLPAAAILPTFVALAGGYLTQIGINNLSGFGIHPLTVPGLPTYDSIQVRDLVFAIIVAIAAAIVAAVVREVAASVDRSFASRWAAPLVGSIITAVVLGIAMAAFEIPVDQVLFSGSSGMATLVEETSIVTVVAVLVAKSVAYAAALGTGFRGGPIFPATFLGVAVGVLAGLVITIVPVTPLVAAGIAATAAVMTRLPATSALLAALLIGGGAAVAPVAIIGAAVGIVIRLSADRWVTRRPSTSTATTGLDASAPR